MKWEFKSKTSVYFILQEEASGAIKAANAGKIVSPSLDALIRQRAASVPWSWGLRSWLIVFLSKFASSVRVLRILYRLRRFDAGTWAREGIRYHAQTSFGMLSRIQPGAYFGRCSVWLPLRLYRPGRLLADRQKFATNCKTRLLKFGNLAIEIWKNKVYQVKWNSINLVF